ncbi:hypothetical protein PsorP6_000831 [Peronosclerospora sorghi]|uniref:Uncharacterized protein n=1 Tax=Peronosclerospora sorghi TaxID=230839 RepID=A0ACC0WXT9_9STRA|nr:hypothetical protein PsorP6_000831 [Peronosclerospora sorghi]
MSSDSFLVDGFLAMESSHSPVLEDFFGLESPLMTVCSAVSSSSSQDKSFLADDDVSSLIVSSSLSRLLGFLPLSNRSERLISVLPPSVFPTKSVRSITRSSSVKAPPLPPYSAFCIPFLVFGAATFMSSPVSFSSIVAGRGSSDGDSSQKKAGTTQQKQQLDHENGHLVRVCTVVLCFSHPYSALVLYKIKTCQGEDDAVAVSCFLMRGYWWSEVATHMWMYSKGVSHSMATI